MKNNIVIGIEGLVGSGKTTICREMLKQIPNSVFLNGSNLYRAIVYVMMKNADLMEKVKSNINNVDIKMVMDKLGVKMTIENRETYFYYNNEKLSEDDLQSKESSMAVSKVGGVANNEKLFEFARNIINELKKSHTVIISGRGIMKIYPDTDYHFFITADLDERVRRKCIQYEDANIEEIKENIVKRDALQKKAGFYDKSKKTIEIDVTNIKTPKEAICKLLEYIK